MSKTVLAFLIVCAICITGQAQVAKDTRPMSVAEYNNFLRQVEVHLPQWEQALQGVDPEKSNLSLRIGTQVANYRDIGLAEIKNTRVYLQQEREGHRVSRELALRGFLQGIFDSMESILVTAPNISVPLESYAPEMGRLISKIANDAQARVERLEQGTCP